MSIKVDYYLVMVLLTDLLAVSMIILVVDNNRLTNKKKTLFIVTPAVVILASLAEYFGVLLDGTPENLRNLHIFLKVFELSVSPIMVFCLVTAFNGFEKGKKLIPIVAINFVIQVISGFTGFLYYFDSKNVYHHNTFYGIYTAIYILCGAIFFRECIRFSRHYQNHNVASLIAILMFLMFGLSIHNLFRDLRADWLTIVIAYSLFYNYYNTLVEQTDSLTQLMDRKSYDIHMQSLKKKVVIIMFDVDEFKKVNDNYGHDAGDLCLKSVANVILNSYLRYGYCYRIGGDEFCVITKKKVNITEINASFYQEIKRLQENPDKIIPNISLGWSVFDPEKETVNQASKRADHAMYKEKSGKRR